MTQLPEQHPEHKLPVPPALEQIGEDIESEKLFSGEMIADAIGGWRGIIDSSLPGLVYVIVYMASGNNLTLAVWTAVAAGVVIAIWRVARKKSVRQVLGGLAFVAFSAWLATKTENAANFFVLNVIVSIAYAFAFTISNLVKWPLVGIMVGAATGDMTGWRSYEPLRRAYWLATWAWAGIFILKSLILTPLYLLELVGPLGIAKIVLGWPVLLLLGLWTYGLVKKPLADYRAMEKEKSDLVAE